MPDLAAGKTLDNNVIDAVDEMYNDDEFTRQLPGRKDFVSVSKNVHVSKRLMLCNKVCKFKTKMVYPSRA